MIWFSSDYHLFHRNIIKFSNRPFIDVDEMNWEIAKRHNEVMDRNDTLYYLGDFGLNLDNNLKLIYELRDMFNVNNFYFILGNHDQLIIRNRDLLIRDKVFNSIQDYLEVSYEKQKIVLFHYAIKVWNKAHHGSWHLYAHSHGTLPEDQTSLSFDIGVDTNNFYPYSFNDVQRKMSTKTWQPLDHHNKNTN